MNLALGPEEELLRDTARALAAERTPVAELRRLRDSSDPAGFSRSLWEEITALGWAGLPFPEAVGGTDAGCFALGVVMEELGRTLAVTPLLSVAMVGTCLANANSPVAEKLLSEAIDGRRLVSLAFDEKFGTGPTAPATTATSSGQGYRLTGRKVLVLDGGTADTFVVSARCGDNLELFLIDATTDGLRRSSTRLVDSRSYATVELDGVAVGFEGLIAGGLPSLATALDRGTAVLAAEMVGIMGTALDLTVEHLKNRRQFGVAIGSFQALQHRAARMYVAVETARSVVADALRRLDTGAEDAPVAVCTAKATANEALRLVTSEAVQMHGGIGITDEADIGLFLKRARVAELTLGDTAYHRRRFASLSGF